MYRTRLSAFVLILAGLAVSASAADTRFPMRLGVRTEPGEVFGVQPDPSSRVRRLYPGETLEVVVTASLAHIDASMVDNATLTSQLSTCVVPGNIESLLGTPQPVNCEPIPGVSWNGVPCPSASGQLCATLTATQFNVPPGTYTVFVILQNQALLSQLGSTGAQELRSTPIRVVTGPPTNSDETLSAKLNAAYRAQKGQNAVAQSNEAMAILSEYPHSVLALWMLADAQEAGGDTAAALATFENALSVLDLGLDVRTPAMQHPQHREARRQGLLVAIKELQESLNP